MREERWSAEQISGWMVREDHGTLSHETIYSMIYREQKSGGDLHHFLPHPAKSYRNRSAGEERRGRLKNQVIIDQRPSIVEEHTRFGYWEIDTVIGRPGRPVLLTMVERRSRSTHPYHSW
ncbi:MAG: IS30 family transposase [Akkermansiaceae bacterium]